MRAPSDSAALGSFGNRRSAVTLVVLLSVVLVSRALLFPASVWEQDEAYFASAVVEVDVADSRPHAPFFPLWIGLGKLLFLAGVPPAVALQAISGAAGSLMVLPLVGLWSRRLGADLSSAAAALVVFVPGVWVLSTRAFTGTTATALLVLALFQWSRPQPTRWTLAMGSAAAGLSVLVRPQLGLVVAAAVAAVLVAAGRRRWPEVVLPVVGVTVAGFGLFFFIAGEPTEILAAVSRHGAAHFGALDEADRSFSASGLARVLVDPTIAALWSGLAVVGVVTELRDRVSRLIVLPTAAALVATAILVFGLSNPAHPRYAVPLVVLSGGFVVAGLGRLMNGRWVGLAVVVAVVASWATVVPVAREVRRLPSPPVRAIERAAELAALQGRTVVADRRLHAFVVMARKTGALTAPMVFDHVFSLGLEPPPPDETVMVFDIGHDGRVIHDDAVETFSCDRALLRRISQDRFLEVRVVDGAAVSGGR
ncbi:MAG: hypothetical protein AB1Z65_15265 [Candidatus Sulfomarinibacteraceae bacterium]